MSLYSTVTSSRLFKFDSTVCIPSPAMSECIQHDGHDTKSVAVLECMHKNIGLDLLCHAAMSVENKPRNTSGFSSHAGSASGLFEYDHESVGSSVSSDASNGVQRLFISPPSPPEAGHEAKRQRRHTLAFPKEHAISQFQCVNPHCSTISSSEWKYDEFDFERKRPFCVGCWEHFDLYGEMVKPETAVPQTHTPKVRPRASSSSPAPLKRPRIIPGMRECNNPSCKTTNASSWRYLSSDKDREHPYCSPCKLYFDAYGRHRPRNLVSLRDQY